MCLRPARLSTTHLRYRIIRLKPTAGGDYRTYARPHVRNLQPPDLICEQSHAWMIGACVLGACIAKLSKQGHGKHLSRVSSHSR